MAYLPFNGGTWWSPDGLGNMLTVDPYDENVVKHVNPLAFGYRVFEIGDDGKLYAPYGYSRVPFELGEKVLSWYTLDENGRPTSAIPEKIQKQLRGYNDLANFGYVPVSNYEQIPYSDRNDRDVFEIIRSNFERLDDDEKQLLRSGGADARSDVIKKLLDGALGRGEKTGIVLDANSGKNLRLNSAPHMGFSFWGLLDPRFAVIPRQGLWSRKTATNVGNLFGGEWKYADLLSRAFAGELERNGIISKSDAQSLGGVVRKGDESKTISDDALRKVATELVESIEDIVPFDEDRKHIVDKIVKSGMAYVPEWGDEGGMSNPKRALILRGRDMPSRSIMHSRPYKEIESFGNALKDVDPEMQREAWDRFMRGQLLDWIHSTIGRGIKGNGVVQVMAPLTGLVPNWAGGQVNMQTDSGNELRALEMTPTRIIANGPEFDKDVEKYYALLKKPGMTAARAWAEALGDKYGNLLYLDSDERIKNVHKSMKNEVDGHIRQKSICHGLTRGP